MAQFKMKLKNKKEDYDLRCFVIKIIKQQKTTTTRLRQIHFIFVELSPCFIKAQSQLLLSTLLGTLGARLSVNNLAGKGAGDGAMAKTRTRSKKQGKGIVRAGHGNKTDF